MRFLVVILSAFMLLQALTPTMQSTGFQLKAATPSSCCSQKAKDSHCSSTTPSPDTHEQDQDGNHDCPPDCHCICCGSLAVMHLAFPSLNVQHQHPTLIVAQDWEHSIELPYSVWQPPRLG